MNIKKNIHRISLKQTKLLKNLKIKGWVRDGPKRKLSSPPHISLAGELLLKRNVCLVTNRYL